MTTYKVTLTDLILAESPQEAANEFYEMMKYIPADALELEVTEMFTPSDIERTEV